MRDWECQLPLCPEAKGNSRMLVNGRSVKSAKAQAFMTAAVLMLRAAPQPRPCIEADEKLRLNVNIRYPNYRRDVDDSLIRDALQGAGIIPNDRQIRAGCYEALDDIGEPMIWIAITRMGKLPWKTQTRRPK